MKIDENIKKQSDRSDQTKSPELPTTSPLSTPFNSQGCALHGMWALHDPYHPNLWRRCLMRPESAKEPLIPLISCCLASPGAVARSLCDWLSRNVQIWEGGRRWMRRTWVSMRASWKACVRRNLISDTCMNTSQNKEYRRKAYKRKLLWCLTFVFLLPFQSRCQLTARRLLADGTEWEAWKKWVSWCWTNLSGSRKSKDYIETYITTKITSEVNLVP